MTEKELYPPVRDLFEKRGYKVNAEVKDCDMTAVKDDEFIIIELKRNMTVTLLAQGLKRQRTGADVFVAVPKPKNYSFNKFRQVFSEKAGARSYIRFAARRAFVRGNCVRAEAVHVNLQKSKKAQGDTARN